MSRVVFARDVEGAADGARRPVEKCKTTRRLRRRAYTANIHYTRLARGLEFQSLPSGRAFGRKVTLRTQMNRRSRRPP